MFRSLIILALVTATPAPLMAQRGRVSQGCPSCSGGNCAAPQAAPAVPSAQAGFQWLPGATANESALYLAGKQVGAVWLPTQTYRSYDGAKWSEPCDPPVPMPGKPASHGDRPGLLSRLLGLHNEYRVRNNLAPFQLDEQLCATAQANAEERARRGVTGHIIGAGGYSGPENCGWGQRSPEQIVGDWIESPGHRENVVGRYRSVGFGVATANGREFWTAQYR